MSTLPRFGFRLFLCGLMRLSRSSRAGWSSQRSRAVWVGDVPGEQLHRQVLLVSVGAASSKAASAAFEGPRVFAARAL
eukprot:6134609-Pyramimonas_sp.AAC.1